MIAVIFEVWPEPAQRERYFDLAGQLRAELEDVDGFISIERFESLTEPGKVLSLSFWRDEDAVRTWRTNAAHRDAQRAGITEVFAHYRLRVAGVSRDYGMSDRAQVPTDSAAVWPGRDSPGPSRGGGSGHLA